MRRVNRRQRPRVPRRPLVAEIPKTANAEVSGGAVAAGADDVTAVAMDEATDEATRVTALRSHDRQRLRRKVRRPRQFRGRPSPPGPTSLALPRDISR